MEGIRMDDIRIQKEITAAKDWFYQETELWLNYIDKQDRTAFQNDGMWNDVLHVMIYAFKMYGHSQERTVRMAGLLCLLRCSGHLHELVQDGMAGVDKKVQFRLLVGDQIMARAVELLAEDEAYELIPYFAGIVVKMSEGMVKYLGKKQIVADILSYTHAPWYEAAFYSAACLAHQSEQQAMNAAKLGFQFGMFWEAKREQIVLEAGVKNAGMDWSVLPDGWEKDTLIQMMEQSLADLEEDKG